jgi:hypothetical protein
MFHMNIGTWVISWGRETHRNALDYTGPFPLTN